MNPRPELDERRRHRAAYQRAWRLENLEKERARGRARYLAERERALLRVQMWYEENREYVAAQRRARMSQRQAESIVGATRRLARWEPHEDALLARIPSNISAASALGRTVASVSTRRGKLRAKAVL